MDPDDLLCVRVRFLFEFPFLQLAGQFVQALVAVVAGLADFSFGKRPADGAAGFLPVGAVGKLTMAEIRSKLREGILQLFLVHELHALGVERGEAGGIGDERIASQAVKLNVARGMATAAELFRNLADGQLKLRAGAVQKAGFADAGISGQAGELSCKRFAQGLVTSTGTPALR